MPDMHIFEVLKYSRWTVYELLIDLIAYAKDIENVNLEESESFLAAREIRIIAMVILSTLGFSNLPEDTDGDPDGEALQ